MYKVMVLSISKN